MNKDEFKLLHKFLLSPIYNTNKNIIILYSYIKKHYDKLLTTGLAKEIIFNYVFKEGKFSDKKLRNLSSEMLLILKNFLLFLHLEKNESLKKKLLHDQISSMSFKYDEQKYLEQLIQNIKTDSSINDVPSVILSKVEQVFDLSIRLSNSIHPNLLSQLINKLDLLVFEASLKYYSAAKLISSSQKQKINCDFGNHISSYIEKLNIQEYPISVQIQYYKFKLRQTKNEIYYHKLKEILYKNYDNISINEKSLVYSYLLNFLVEERSLESLTRYCNEELELRLHQIETTIDSKGFIPDSIFINTVCLQLRMKKFPDTLVFIDKYNKYLNSKIANSVVNTALGKLHSSMKEFGKAIQFFSKVKHNHWYYKVQAMSNSLICFFELNDFKSVRLLSSQLFSYCNKNRVVYPFMKSNQKNFVKFLTRYISLLEINNLKKIPSLLSEIQNSKRFSYKEWLLEKINEYIKKRQPKKLPSNSKYKSKLSPVNSYTA
ncbi:MAG TPA: hypothetical protein PKE39_11655 [Ignavibacteria bacterium]|nr:hypothetical protein [Ignavibacteria bacterium]